jgi:hypothetical protein
VAVDRFGNTVVTGYYSASITIGTTTLQTTSAAAATFVARFDKNGRPIWTFGIGAPNAASGNSAGSLALDSNGNIYFTIHYGGTVIVGTSTFYSVGNALVLAKCDSNGNVIWAKNLPHVSAGGAPNLLATDSLSNCYFWLRFQEVDPFDPTFTAPSGKSENGLVKIDKNGALVYDRHLSTLDTLLINCIASSKSGVVYATGALGHDSVIIDGTKLARSAVEAPVLMTFNATGHLQVGKSFNDHGRGAYAQFISSDAAENTYISGIFFDTIQFGAYSLLSQPPSFYAGFLAKCDPTGNVVWATKIGDSTNGGANTTSDAAGDVYCGDDYTGTQHFGSFTLTDHGNGDIAIVKYNTNGKVVWALQGGSSNQDELIGMGIDRYGSTYFVGDYFNSTQFGNITLTGISGQSAGYAAKITEPTILTQSPGNQLYCAGDTVQVDFTSNGVYRPGNQFEALLSDSVGVFDSVHSITIGKTLSTSDTGVINCVLPVSTHFGKAYKIRVDATTPVLSGLEIGPYFTIGARPIATISPRKPATFCQGGQTDLYANGGQYYRWSLSTDGSFSDTSQTLITSKAGTYYVAVTDTNGCDARDSIVVKVLPLPTAILSPANDTSFCEGGSLKLMASGGKSYLWSDNEKTASITVTTSGSYDVSVTNDSGCTATSNPVVVTVNPLPPTPTITEQNLTLTSSSDSNNQWYYYGKALAGDTSKTLLITQNGDYAVEVHNRYGCAASSNMLHITDGVSLNAPPSALNLSIAPNPLAGSTTLSYDLAVRSHIRIDILDVLGATIKTVVNEFEDAGHHAQTVTFDETVPDGTYFVRCVSNGTVLTRSLVLLR